MTAVRPPAVAGSFYPGSERALRTMVRELLASAHDGTAAGGSATRGAPDGPAAKAIVAPHAGYVYSGSTAALAYAPLAPRRDAVRRVVLLGPCHRVAVRGLALPGCDAFETPLGTVPVDADGVAAIAGLPQVTTSPEAHEWEHSLEVHLPFLQEVLGEFTLVPLAVGRATPDEVAEVVDALWGGPETLVVASSDLSHYLSYAQARAVDEVTIEQVLAGTDPLNHEQACGATPVNGVNVAARRRGLAPRLLGACNSGDTAGDKKRVVGYASFAFAAADGAEAGVAGGAS